MISLKEKMSKSASKPENVLYISNCFDSAVLISKLSSFPSTLFYNHAFKIDRNDLISQKTRLRIELETKFARIAMQG